MITSNCVSGETRHLQKLCRAARAGKNVLHLCLPRLACIAQGTLPRMAKFKHQSDLRLESHAPTESYGSGVFPSGQSQRQSGAAGGSEAS